MKLKNGCRVLMKHTGVVLCHRPGTSQPYVTWRVNDAGEAYWGHYFTAYEEAVHSFNERAGLSDIEVDSRILKDLGL